MTGNITEKVKNIIQEVLLDSVSVEFDLTDDMSLVDGGLLDSLSIVRVVQMLMDQFPIEIGVEDITLDNFDTLGTIVRLVQSRVDS